MLKSYINLLRPHQYLKNGFVLVGVIFSRQWDYNSISAALHAFIAFCLISSASYILNDIIDAEEDRQHPVKQNRPIANGSISNVNAWIFFIVLSITAFSFAMYNERTIIPFIGLYLAINIAYSFLLKKIVILDVFVISAGFMLRLLTGTMGIGIYPSHWLLLCGLMLTLFLGFSKRKAELMTVKSNNIENTRISLKKYSKTLLDQFIGISAACTILSYSLFTVSETTIEFHGSSDLIYTIPFVVFGIFRYLFLLDNSYHGNDTAKDLINDVPLLLTVAGWLAVSISIIL